MEKIWKMINQQLSIQIIVSYFQKRTKLYDRACNI